MLGRASEHRAADAHPTDWSGEGESLERALGRDTYPLPAIEYGPHHFSYWASGHRDARRGMEAIGCDINRRHVDWVSRHLPSSVRVFQNHSIPTLPLPD